MSHHIPSVSWQQARQILHEQGLDIAHHVKTESLPLLATIGHYLADDVYSMMPVPHYSDYKKIRKDLKPVKSYPLSIFKV